MQQASNLDEVTSLENFQFSYGQPVSNKILQQSFQDIVSKSNTMINDETIKNPDEQIEINNFKNNEKIKSFNQFIDNRDPLMSNEFSVSLDEYFVIQGSEKNRSNIFDHLVKENQFINDNLTDQQHEIQDMQVLQDTQDVQEAHEITFSQSKKTNNNHSLTQIENEDKIFSPNVVSLLTPSLQNDKIVPSTPILNTPIDIENKSNQFSPISQKYPSIQMAVPPFITNFVQNSNHKIIPVGQNRNLSDLRFQNQDISAENVTPLSRVITNTTNLENNGRNKNSLIHKKPSTLTSNIEHIIWQQNPSTNPFHPHHYRISLRDYSLQQLSDIMNAYKEHKINKDRIEQLIQELFQKCEEAFTAHLKQIEWFDQSDICFTLSHRAQILNHVIKFFNISISTKQDIIKYRQNINQVSIYDKFHQRLGNIEFSNIEKISSKSIYTYSSYERELFTPFISYIEKLEKQMDELKLKSNFFINRESYSIRNIFNEISDNPFFVNPKQYPRILKRREQRKKQYRRLLLSMKTDQEQAIQKAQKSSIDDNVNKFSNQDLLNKSQNISPTRNQNSDTLIPNNIALQRSNIPAKSTINKTHDSSFITNNRTQIPQPHPHIRILPFQGHIPILNLQNVHNNNSIPILHSPIILNPRLNSINNLQSIGALPNFLHKEFKAPSNQLNQAIRLDRAQPVISNPTNLPNPSSSPNLSNTQFNVPFINSPLSPYSLVNMHEMSQNSNNTQASSLSTPLVNNTSTLKAPNNQKIHNLHHPSNVHKKNEQSMNEDFSINQGTTIFQDLFQTNPNSSQKKYTNDYLSSEISEGYENSFLSSPSDTTFQVTPSTPILPKKRLISEVEMFPNKQS